MQFISYIIVVLFAYLVGSIPTGFLLAKARGIDIRTVGSGNMGATNVFRVLGKTAGITALVVDGLKGYVAAKWLCDLLLPMLNVSNPGVELQIIAGIAAVLGHNYTCWLHFKGGKGIATTAGVYFALAWLPVTIALGTWIIVVVLTRYVSIASIASAIALPAAVWSSPDSHSLLLKLVTTALGTMAIINHKKNIQRLLNGTEDRIGRKASVYKFVSAADVRRL